MSAIELGQIDFFAKIQPYNFAVFFRTPVSKQMKVIAPKRAAVSQTTTNSTSQIRLYKFGMKTYISLSVAVKGLLVAFTGHCGFHKANKKLQLRSCTIWIRR